MDAQTAVPQGVIDRAWNLLSDQVLTIIAMCLLGVIFSWLYTQARKPYIDGGDKRKLKIRTEAMVVATLVSGFLLTLIVEGGWYAKTVVIGVLSPMSGLSSPPLFDVWTVWAWPKLKRRFMKRAVGDATDETDVPTIFKDKKQDKP